MALVARPTSGIRLDPAIASGRSRAEDRISAAPAWWHPARRRRVRIALMGLAAAVIASQWARIVMRPEGDFTLHWIFGRRFRLGAFLYAGGMHVPYPPTWGMVGSLLTLGPMATMRAVLYPFGLVPLAALLAIVHRMATPRGTPSPRGERLFWSTALALALGSRFLIRELPECGTNLTMTALTWAGVYAWSRGREGLGGLSLGLSIALKCTSALFVVYFAWRRQWKMVAATTAAAAAFTLAPALTMGRASYEAHMRHWLGNVWAGATASDPLESILGDDPVGNQSLRPTLARLLVRVPPDHLGHCSHPWRLQPLDLEPETASRVIGLASLGLLVGCGAAIGWRAPRRDGVAAAWEAASVSLLMLVLSPITWRQHCVAALPALVLIARGVFAPRGGLPRGWRGPLALYVVLVLVLDRGVVGPELTYLLDSYGATTWGLLALLGVSLAGARAAAREERQAEALAVAASASRAIPAPHIVVRPAAAETTRPTREAGVSTGRRA